MNFWQVAAGEGSRDYSDVFLKFGIMLVGGGDPGSFMDRQDYYKGHTGWRADITRFSEEAEEGNIIILKRPYGRKWEIIAVGRIIGGYEYLELFEDVDGWDLQHCRRVEWVRPNEKTYVNGLARGTFRRVSSQKPREKALQILKGGAKIKPDKLPPPAKKVSDEQLVESLVDSGLRPIDAETVISTIWRVRRLAHWYKKHGQDISEHETRTFLIVPVLQALGWSEQKMKIEWKNIDIAFFQQVYKKDGNLCVMILESKRMGEGLTYAERQAQTYQKQFPECLRLIVSNGLCYKLYEKRKRQWKCTAYFNLLRLKNRHPYYVDIKGASEVFVNLMAR